MYIFLHISISVNFIKKYLTLNFWIYLKYCQLKNKHNNLFSQFFIKTIKLNFYKKKIKNKNDQL